jgi:TolB-like protein
MKYQVGTKFHMWYNANPESPMYGEIMSINEKTEIYHMTFVYTDKDPYSSHYSDGLLHDILYQQDREYLRIESPITLDEELFRI